MRKATDTLTRQWTMLQHVPAHPLWISTPELHKYLASQGHDIDIRTIQRDMERLSSRFPLYSESQGRTNVWQWAKGAHALEIPSMTPATALVFKLVEQHLEPLLPASTLELIQPYIGRATEVLRSTKFRKWHTNVRLLRRGPVLTAPNVPGKVRDVVYQALLEGRRFNASYSPRGADKKSDYVVNPLALVLKDGIAYLVSTLWDYDDIKHLALHRFQSARLSDEPCRHISSFNLDDYIEKQATFAYPLSTRKIRLKARFQNDAAFHLQESRLSQDQTLEAVDDEHTLVTATVPDSFEIRWWLLGFGDQVEVLAPKSLRKEFADIVGILSAYYR